MLATSLPLYFSDTPSMLTPSSNFTAQKGLICVMQGPHIEQQSLLCIPFTWCKTGPAKMPDQQFIIIRFCTSHSFPNTVLAIAGGTGGGALLLVVIIGILLCVLVIRKVCHAATKSQSKLYTLWGFFSAQFSIN